jgi:hypothetical protein
MIQQYHSGGYTQRNATQITPKASAHPCLLQHYSQQPSYGNNQDAPLLTNGSRKCGIVVLFNELYKIVLFISVPASQLCKPKSKDFVFYSCFLKQIAPKIYYVQI